MKRTIVIADLHGCFEEAQDLLDRVAASASDRVIFVGDLVDRGPKPRECVELAMRYECVLGNHEEKHLRQRKSADAALSPDHLRTRRSLEPKHYAWFETLPTYVLLPEHDAAIVHAGALPDVAIAAQNPYHLLHAQCVRPPERKSYWPSKAPATHTFWTNHWRGPERVIFGHTVLDRPLVTEHAVGIDTGCVHGGGLTCVVLPDWSVVTVPSRARPDAHGPERRSGAIARYPIHGEVHAFS
jgi:hypothetical protein